MDSYFFNFSFGYASRHVGSQFPSQESNPHTLHWKHNVLTTGPPGRSLGFLFYALGYKLIWFIYVIAQIVPASATGSSFRCLLHPTPSWWGFSLSAFLPSVTTRGCPSSCVFPLPVLSSVQSLSCVRLFATPWIAAHQASLSITNSRSLLKLMPIELVMPSNHLIFCHPLLLLPPIPPSIRVFSNESALHIRWPKYWSFSFSISPSNEYPGLISFRVDWLDLLTVQGTLKSLLQHDSSKASIFRRFTVHLSHPYMTTGKTIALTRQTFVGKEMSAF